MIAAIFLAFLSSVVIYWQTGRVLPLFDYTYQIENAYRIAVGQVPYRDFILITTPLMHGLLALFMRIFGFSSVAPLLYMIFTSFFVVLATYWVLVLLKINKRLHICFLLPLVFAAHGIVPLPSYDVTATLFVLLSLGWILRFIFLGPTNFLTSFIAGVLLVLPVLTKQNVGFSFMASAYLTLGSINWIKPQIIRKRTILVILAGSMAVGILFGIILGLSHSLLPFIRQNRFVWENRDPLNYASAILYDVVYWKNLLIYFPIALAYFIVKPLHSKYWRTAIIASAVAFSISIIPAIFFFTIFRQTIYIDLSLKLQVAVRYFVSVWYLVLILTFAFVTKRLFNLRKFNKKEYMMAFTQVILGFATMSALLAQGVGGSTFGIYPFFILLLASLYQICIHSYDRISWDFVYKTALILTTIFLMVFAYFNIRQSYVPVIGIPNSFVTRSLWHLATPGLWTKEIDNMFLVVKKTIPYDQTVVALPGEDPFYFVTGRKPQLRYFELFSGALPYSPERIANDIAINNIDWLVIKTNLQSSYYMDTKPIIKKLSSCFVLYRQIPSYSLYRRYHSCQ